MIPVAEAVWASVQKNFSDKDLSLLQAYWIDTQLRGRESFPQGPEWRSQNSRGKMAAAIGGQRYQGDSKRGLDHLFPPGLGPEGHIAGSADLESPFNAGRDCDDDLKFAARALARLGPHIKQWRRIQERALQRIMEALDVLDTEIRGHMHPDVAMVTV